MDGDTPLLVIRFFDSTQPETPKAVNQLRVIGLGNGDPVPTIADRTSLDSIALPLRPGETETTFILIQDSQDEENVETGNPDTLRLISIERDDGLPRFCREIPNYPGLAGSDASASSGSEI